MVRWVGPLACGVVAACQPRPPPPGAGGDGTDGSSGPTDVPEDGGDACEGMICDPDVAPDAPPRCEPPGRSARDPRRDECSPSEQDCPPGDKCSIWGTPDLGPDAWGPSRCVPLAADAAMVGRPCTVSALDNLGCDDCEAGSVCWNVDEQTVTGLCMAFCAGEPRDPLCPEDTACVGRDGWSFDVCLPRCDPLMQQCVGIGEGCFELDEQFVCFPGAGAGRFGDACARAESCAPGLACLPVASVPDCPGVDGCCSPYCDLGESSPCADYGTGLECISVFGAGPAPEGYEHVGACALPG